MTDATTGQLLRCRVRRLIRASDFQNGDIAEFLDITPQALARSISGEKGPGLDDVRRDKIFEALELPATALLITPPLDSRERYILRSVRRGTREEKIQKGIKRIADLIDEGLLIRTDQGLELTERGNAALDTLPSTTDEVEQWRVPQLNPTQ